MKISTTRDLKTALRSGRFTSVGGYPTYFITSDGTALSHDAARNNLRTIFDSIRTDASDGWRIVAVDVNWEDPALYCDDTGCRIESAYAEDDADAPDLGSHRAC